jgi:hypothetical protein
MTHPRIPDVAADQVTAVPQIGPPEAGLGAQPAPAEAATISLPFDRFVATSPARVAG